MPRVPLYQQQVQRSAQPNARLNVQVTPQAMGSSLAQASGQLSGQLAQMAKEEKNKADQISVTQADFELGAWQQNFLLDPDAGALNRRGTDAFDLPEVAEQEFTKTVGEIEKGLSNDTQRQAFRQAVQQRQLSLSNSVQRHVSSEMQSHDNQVTQDAIALSQQELMNDYADPLAVRYHIEKQLVLYEAFAERNGLPQETVDLRTLEIQGKAHTDVMNRLAREAPAAARLYYEQNKDEIKGDWAVAAENTLETVVREYEAKEMASDIATGSEEKLSVWLRKANEIEDKKTREMAISELNFRWNIVKTERDEQVQEAFTLIEDGGSVSDISNEQWGTFTPQVRNNLETRQRQVMRGIEPVNDDLAYIELTDLPIAEVAEMSGGEFFAKYRTILDDSHWSRAMAYRQSAQAEIAKQRGEEVKVPKYPTLRTISDVTKDVAGRVGIIPLNKPTKDWNTTQVQRYQSFLSTAQERVEQARDLKGADLTPTEIADVVNEAAAERVLTKERGTWFGIRDRGFTGEVPAAALLEGEERVAIPYEDIPEDDLLTLQLWFERTNGIRPRDSRDIQYRMQQAYELYSEVATMEVPDEAENPELFEAYRQRMAEIKQILKVR